MADRRSGSSVTLHDVAHAAGVSLATASRTLNGSTRHVRADLRAKVLQAAEALQYSANTSAQTMARGKSNVVGVVVSDIADPYFSSIAAALIRAAEEHGLVVTMACTLRRPEREADYVAALRGQRAHSAVLVGSRVADRRVLNRLTAEVRAFEDAGGRVAMISQRKLPVDTVVIENRAGAKSLAEELCRLGHRRFGVLAGPSDLLTARDRLAGFRQGLAQHDVTLSPDQIVSGAFTRDGGYEAAQQLLDRDPRVTCVFAVNDVMAVGAMAGLRDRGVSLPTGMAVAGFDDIVTLRDVSPSLTTVRLPLEDLGASALDLVVQPRADQPRVRRVAGEVVVRESTPRRR